MDNEFLWYVLAGFVAQLVDGSLGMAYGVTAVAPIGAWACKHIPVKPFMILLGVLVVAMSLRTILKHQGVI